MMLLVGEFQVLAKLQQNTTKYLRLKKKSKNRMQTNLWFRLQMKGNREKLCMIYSNSIRTRHE